MNRQQNNRERRAAHKVLPKAGVTCFYNTFVLNPTLVFQINCSAETPRLRQYPNRYMLKHIHYLFLITTVLYLASCKSKKTVVVSVPNRTNTAEVYSKKLGYDVGKGYNEKLLGAVVNWLGTPYKYNGCAKDGIDCSCFVKNVYNDVYQIELKRNTEDMAKQISSIKKHKLKEGDLLFFKTEGNKISHVGLFLKDNKFVHASTKKGVMVSDLTEPYFEKTLYKCGRIKNK